MMKKNVLTLSLSLTLLSQVYAQQVGIGTNTPDASAKLDIASGGSMGILFPRVALTATNVAGPVSAPANWLTVFNTATAGSGSTAVVPGLYYWNGTAWVKLDTDAWRADGNTNGAFRTLGTNDAFDLGLETNGTERMRITTAGNVGIGNTTPTNRLHVGATEGQGIDIGNPNDAMGLDGGSTSIRFYGYRDVINNAFSAKISAERTNICCGYLSQGTDLAFYTNGGLVTPNADNSIERMRIKDNGNVIVANLAGVGTRLVKADATGTLVIDNTLPTGSNLYIQNQYVGAQTTSNYWVSGNGRMDGGLTVGAGATIDNNNTNTGTVSAGALAFGSGSGEGIGSKRSAGGNQFGLDFYTNSVNRMLITQAGNVGIGTTTPGATLNVIHPTANTTPTKPTGNWAAIVENNQDAADSRNGLSVATRWGGDASTVFEAGSYWTGAAQAYTPILSVKGSLNVGIGITSPPNKLTINTANTTAATTSTYPFAVARAGTVDYTIGSDASFAYTQSWNSKPLLINAMGNNVGIGLTTAPTAQLHTTGSVRFAGITNGLLGVDASGNVGTRTMAVSGTGIAITNGNGVAGNPTYNLNYGASLASAAGGAYPVGNFGQFEPHGTYTDFNTTPNYWGWNYVQGATNGPNTTSSQWYRQNVSLGSNYPGRGAGGYSLEMAYPRFNTSSAGVWMRTVENGTTGPWQRTDGGAKGVSSTLHPSMDDITGWTTVLNACTDDGVYTINWGFPFSIDGVNYTQGWISTNGVLGFGTGSSNAYLNTALPASISNDPMLFFHWDDDGSDLIRYVVQGTAPNRNCFIQWQGSEATSCTSGSSRVMAYITLSEGSNVVSVRYLNQGSTADAQGAGATFGFQYSGGAAAGTIPMGFNTKLLDDNATNQAFSIDF